MTARRNLLLAGLLMIVPVCASLSGCTRAPEVEVVRFWAFGREPEVVTQFVPEFERLNPGIRIEVQQVAWTAAHEKLLTAFAGDSTPDICQLGNTWIAEFQALDAIEPLDARIAASQVIDKTDYFEGIWATNVLEGATYGVPWYVDTRLLFYRRDLLAEAGFSSPPRTWAEWLEMMRAIKKRVGPDRYSVLLPLNEFEPLQVLALQESEPMLRDNGRYGNFRSASFREALAFYAQMFAEDLAPQVTNTQISNVWLELGRGYYSFYIGGPWNIGEFKRRLPADQQDTWMTASMPGPRGPGVSTAGGASLVIFRRSRHKEAGWKFIEFLSRPDIQQRFHAATGDLPARRTAWSADALAGDVYTQAFREQLERVRPSPPVPEWQRIMEEMRNMSERVTHGGETIDAGVTRLDALVDDLLEKRRWMLAREEKR